VEDAESQARAKNAMKSQHYQSLLDANSSTRFSFGGSDDDSGTPFDQASFMSAMALVKTKHQS
jgi:hypothetical protein